MKNPGALAVRGKPMMKSAVVKRSVTIGGHKTSVSLEEGFWEGLRDIATHRRLTLSALLAEIDITRETPNLSSQIRLFVLEHYRLLGLDQPAGDARRRPPGPLKQAH